VLDDGGRVHVHKLMLFGLMGLKAKQAYRRDDGTVLEDLTTTYDCLGRITSKVDAAHQTKFFRGTQATPRRSYWYDSFGRLV
jgi:YD repeat-containing protein